MQYKAINVYTENILLLLRFTGGNTCEIKTDLYFVKLIMWKISYIPLEIFWQMNPCQECQEKVEFSIVQVADSSHFLINLF